MRRIQSFLLPFSAAILACATSACGGGSGSAPTPTISSGSTGSSGTGSGTTTQSTATASIVLSLQQYAPVKASATKRRAAFLSPATAQISFTVVSVNGVAQTGSTVTFPVGPNATNCSSVSGVVTCTLNMTLPTGTDVLSASTLDSTNTPLGTSQISTTVYSNGANRIALAIGGTVASVELFLSKNSFTPGAASRANVIVVPFDSSGAQIVNPGNYNPPIPITEVNDSGATGHFSLFTNGTNTGLTSTVTSPNDQVVLNYDGSGSVGSTTITAAPGAPVAPASVSAAFNMAGLSAVPSGAQLAGPSFIFSTAGQTGAIDIAGGTAPYTVTSSDTSLATVAGSGSHFTITAVGYGVNGAASITVTDHLNATTTTPVTFIAPPITLTVGTCGSGNTCATVAGGITSTYPAPQNGTSVYVNPTIFTASGGTGTYTYAFASTGTTTGVYATVTQAGSQFTVQPVGNGNEGVIVMSGNQTAYFGSTSTSGTPAYILGSTFLAYATAANQITIAKNSSVAGQATIALTTAGAPWTITNNCSGLANVVDLNNSVVVLAAATSGQCVVTFVPSTGTAPSPLTVTLVPDISVSPTTLALHATNEIGHISINNPAAVYLGSISESSGGSVIQLQTYSAGTLVVRAVGTGVSRIKVHDANLDQDAAISVAVDNAFQLALPQAIGMIGGTPYSQSVNYALASGVVLSGFVNGFSVTAGSPGTISASPLTGTSGTGTIRFFDTASGSVDVGFTVFKFTPSLYPGSAIGASATVGFSAVGQVDTVTVAGPAGSIGVTQTNPSVASFTVAGSNIGITALAAGTTTFTVTDSLTGASQTFTVSVTTTTIPIAGHARHP